MNINIWRSILILTHKNRTQIGSHLPLKKINPWILKMVSFLLFVIVSVLFNFDFCIIKKNILWGGVFGFTMVYFDSKYLLIQTSDFAHILINHLLRETEVFTNHGGGLVVVRLPCMREIRIRFLVGTELSR